MPAIAVKGVSRAKGRGSQSPRRPLIALEMQKRAGRCLHVRYVEFVRGEELENSVRAIDCMRAGAGSTSNDANGSNPLTARSNGLDNVDGGPDAAFYIQMGVIEQVSIFGWF